MILSGVDCGGESAGDGEDLCVSVRCSRVKDNVCCCHVFGSAVKSNEEGKQNQTRVGMCHTWLYTVACACVYAFPSLVFSSGLRGLGHESMDPVTFRAQSRDWSDQCKPRSMTRMQARNRLSSRKRLASQNAANRVLRLVATGARGDAGSESKCLRSAGHALNAVLSRKHSGSWS